MNIWDILLMITLVGVLAGAFALTRRRKKSGCCGDCCSCSGCDKKK